VEVPVSIVRRIQVQRTVCGGLLHFLVEFLRSLYWLDLRRLPVRVEPEGILIPIVVSYCTSDYR
jgi:hypothetical protein